MVPCFPITHFLSISAFSAQIVSMEEKQREEIALSAKVLVETVDFKVSMLCFLSSLTTDPLFSVFVTLYTLILLYFPKQFFSLIFSPILISTSIILSTLLRLGSVQQSQKEDCPNSPNQALESVNCEEAKTETKTEHETETKIENCVAPNAYFSEPFFEWNVRAPLEVIYEEYDEGIEENEDEDLKDFNEEKQSAHNGVVSLALYYPESSDSESSSDGDFSGIEGWDSPENICFRWDEEEKDDLIEIELDGLKKSCFDFQVEEDNLIEIEISHGFN